MDVCLMDADLRIRALVDEIAALEEKMELQRTTLMSIPHELLLLIVSSNPDARSVGILVQTCTQLRTFVYDNLNELHRVPNWDYFGPAVVKGLTLRPRNIADASRLYNDHYMGAKKHWRALLTTHIGKNRPTRHGEVVHWVQSPKHGPGPVESPEPCFSSLVFTRHPVQVRVCGHYIVCTYEDGEEPVRIFIGDVNQDGIQRRMYDLSSPVVSLSIPENRMRLQFSHPLRGPSHAASFCQACRRFWLPQASSIYDFVERELYGRVVIRAGPLPDYKPRVGRKGIVLRAVMVGAGVACEVVWCNVGGWSFPRTTHVVKANLQADKRSWKPERGGTGRSFEGIRTSYGEFVDH